MRVRFLKRGEGYTFMELLLAVTILAFITAPLLALLAAGFNTINAAGQQTAAVNLARAAMESVKAAGYDAVETGPNYIEETTLPEVPGFHRVTEIFPLPPGSGDALQELELLQVRITVSWPERGTVRSVTLESYISRK